MARVHTPVEGFSGTVAGVVFADGVAECDDANALAYFDRHGYRVEPTELVESVEPTDSEDEDEDEASASDDVPAGNASAAEWRAYAITKGLDEARVDAMTRDQIRELF